MRYEITTNDEGVVLTLSGDIDLTSAPDLKRVLAQYDGSLVIDLSEVTFLDSSGINALVVSRREHLENGSRFAVRGVSERTVKVFDLIGVLNYLNVEPEGDGPSDPR